MTNQEIAAQFRDMAAQYISQPNSKSAVMFRQAADRLEAMDGLLAAAKKAHSDMTACYEWITARFGVAETFDPKQNDTIIQLREAIAEAEKNL